MFIASARSWARIQPPAGIDTEATVGTDGCLLRLAVGGGVRSRSRLDAERAKSPNVVSSSSGLTEVCLLGSWAGSVSALTELADVLKAVRVDTRRDSSSIVVDAGRTDDAEIGLDIMD